MFVVERSLARFSSLEDFEDTLCLCFNGTGHFFSDAALRAAAAAALSGTIEKDMGSSPLCGGEQS
jgi:hypothetical protein